MTQTPTEGKLWGVTNLSLVFFKNNTLIEALKEIWPILNFFTNFIKNQNFEKFILDLVFSIFLPISDKNFEDKLIKPYIFWKPRTTLNKWFYSNWNIGIFDLMTGATIAMVGPKSEKMFIQNVGFGIHSL